MLTEIFSATSLNRAASLLEKGELVAFPTETVYGLGAIIDQPGAIDKIFAAKGRPSDNPLIAHIADKEDLEKIVGPISKEEHLIMEAFFPGPLTLILPSKADVPHQVRASLPTLAVRMPSLPLARELIRLVGTPLVAPSANLSGRPSATTAQHVLDDLGGKIAAVVDAGPCSLGIESTVLRLGEEPMILRPGSITPQQIEKVLGRPVALYSKKEHQGPIASPGMKYRHYAPRAEVKLFFSQREFDAQQSHTTPEKSLICPHCPPERLYELLRQADREQKQEVLIYCNSSMQKDLALMNRLLRAANAI